MNFVPARRDSAEPRRLVTPAVLFAEPLESRQMMAIGVNAVFLINADTSKDILNLHSSITLNLATLPSRHLNMRAAVATGTGSVKFGYDANPNYRIETKAPLAFAGDDGKGHYFSWAPTVGKHAVSVTPYTLGGATGTAGAKVTITFTVIDVAPPNPSPNGIPVAGNWAMSFDEEFNAPISSDTWTQSIWGTTLVSGDAQAYDPSAVSVANGLLTVTARRETLEGRNFVSGILTTGGIPGEKAPGFSFKYGYIETRMKVARGRGLWSAFWMLPTANPDGTLHDNDGELDIIEHIGVSPSSATMFAHKGSARRGTDYNTGIDLTAAFHTYGLDWQADHLTWYMDGKALFSITDKSVIPTVAEYLILNLTVGTSTSWPGAPSAQTIFPTSMQVDWIRVWQKTV